jgi:hypothetical protein
VYAETSPQSSIELKTLTTALNKYDDHKWANITYCLTKNLLKFLSGAKKSWDLNEEGKRREKIEREKLKTFWQKNIYIRNHTSIRNWIVIADNGHGLSVQGIHSACSFCKFLHYSFS